MARKKQILTDFVRKCQKMAVLERFSVNCYVPYDGFEVILSVVALTITPQIYFASRSDKNNRKS